VRTSGNGGGRGEVKEFSPSSARRLKKYLRECTAEYDVMVTLTYPEGHGKDGPASKRHLRELIRRLRRYSVRRCVDPERWSCFWVMEFQQSGSIHYHLAVTGYYPKKWLSYEWFHICGTDDSRHQQAGTRIEKIKSGKSGLGSYFAKYAAKSVQKEVPEDLTWSGRFWGVSGWRGTVSAAIMIPASEEGQNATIRQRKGLRDVLEDGVFNGTVKRLDDGTRSGTLFAINSSYVKSQVLAYISIMGCRLATMVDTPIPFNMLPPELREELENHGG